MSTVQPPAPPPPRRAKASTLEALRRENRDLRARLDAATAQLDARNRNGHAALLVVDHAKLVSGQVNVLRRTLDALVHEPVVDRFLGHVMKAIAQQLRAPSGAIYLADPDDRFLLHMTYENGRVRTGTELASHPDAFRPVERDGNPAEIAWGKGQSVVIPDMAKDRLMRPYQRKYLLKLGVKSWLGLPLTIAGKCIGCLTVRNSVRHNFPPEELELAHTLCHVATMAVQLTRLAHRAEVAAVTEERNRMAREIHDTLAQGFMGIILQLQDAERTLGHDHRRTLDALSTATELARENLAEARRSVWSLHPRDLDGRNLPDALGHWLEALPQRGRPEVSLRLSGKYFSLGDQMETQLMRIAQEAVNNAFKHARAKRVVVKLSYRQHGVRLAVTDDGCGFDPARPLPPDDRFGIIGMRERAASLGGQVDITSQPGKGTTVSVSLKARRPTPPPRKGRSA